MPFGLKNAGATYQRAMTAIFHDMIHDFVEDYVDDLVVKSKRAPDHIMHLEKVFERCRKYKLKMNPKKCAFAVNTGKFLGVTVHRKGITADETKAAAVRGMPSPANQDQLRTLIGKISYLRRFIPGLAELTSPMMKLLKKGAPFYWGNDCEKGLQRIKEVLTAPQLMIPPEPGQPILMYIAATENSLGALIAQEKDGVERPIYYLSRLIRGAESNYSPVEK